MTSHAMNFPTLGKNLTTEVCVIGAGIAGLSIAYMLSREGKKVIVVDKGPVGFGETGVTTAHLSNVLDDRYFAIKHCQGLKKTKLALESHIEAIDLIESIIKKEKIECDFKRVDGYLFLGKGDKEETLDRELKLLNELGYKKVSKHYDGPHGGKFGVCLKFSDQAQFHPLKYLFGLARAIIKNGGEIYVNSLVQSFEETKDDVKVKLENGSVISAETTVMATNVPFEDKTTFMYAKQAAYRTYVIAGEVFDEKLAEALYWETGSPYHYSRYYSFKDAHSKPHHYLLVGGEDHKTGQEKEGVDPYNNLRSWSKINFPMMKQEDLYEFSGQILNTMDKLAFIGLNPGNKRVYVTTGFSGSGMTYGPMAGQIISDLVLGKVNLYTKLYSPGRLNVKGWSRFMKEGWDVVVEYFGDLMPRKNPELQNLAKGSGMVLSEGLKKTAVYKDKTGKICKYSATCPHLGCFVRWNTSEATWDCPCHGSRFDAHGKVLNGPAKTDLEPLDK